ADLLVAARAEDEGVPGQDHRGRAALVIARLRSAPKTPLAVAGILSMPLFFVALMAISLAVEEPTVAHVLRHGRRVSKLGDPTSTIEAEIWLLAFAATAVVVLAGVAGMLIGRGGLVVPSPAAIGMAAGLIAPIDGWVAEHSARYPLGVDLTPPGTSADVFLRGEWEATARHTAEQLAIATIVIAALAVAVLA